MRLMHYALGLIFWVIVLILMAGLALILACDNPHSDMCRGIMDHFR